MTAGRRYRWRTCVVGVCLLLPAGSFEAHGASTTDSVDDCRERVRLRPEELEAYRCYWIIARQQNQWEAALEGLEALLAEDPGQPRVLLYMGTIASDRGEQRAEGLLLQAAEGFAAEAEPTGEVYARLALTFWLDKRNRLGDSRRQVGLALEAATASGDEVLVSRVLLAQAWHAARDHDYATARSLFLEVEPVAFPNGPFDVRISVVNGLGYVGWATGRYRSALASYRRQAELAARGGDLFEETGALYNVALMAEHLALTPADKELTRAAYRDALEATLRSGDRELEARLCLMLAAPSDGHDSRRGQASKALAAARAAGIPELEIQAMRCLALHDLAAAGGDAPDAIERIHDAIERARTLGNLYEETTGRIDLATALLLQGDRAGGLEESLAALDGVDALRSLQTADEERARVSSTWAYAFNRPIGWLLESGDDSDRELALQLMERLRFHSLLDLLESADASPQPAIGSADAVSIAAVQSVLGDNEMLLSYQLANRLDGNGDWQGGSWLVTITSDRSAAYPLPDRDDIEVAADVYLGLVRRGDERESAAAHRLYELVLAPALAGMEPTITTLVVVPDGVLAGLPLVALQPESGGPPIVDRMAVLSTPSVSRWLRQREVSRVRGGTGCLGVADPELGDRASRWRPLPRARTEVHKACRRIGGASRAIVGADATESAVKEMLLTPFDIVHFATHAEVDSADPRRTAILLATGDESQDGRLGIDEISNLELAEPMVVLSACRSAGGVVLQGEGVLGLTRAFFESGARTVIGNLWPVDDCQAERLVDRFYRHLTAGLPVAQALAQAQRDRLEAGAPTAHWASLAAFGDGSFGVHRTPGRFRPALALIAVAALGVVAALLVTRMRR